MTGFEYDDCDLDMVVVDDGPMGIPERGDGSFN
jgi:hypothetical protein